MGELTKFVQPSAASAALNRVLGGQTSIIDGTLSANGQIYLINGNGIVVGPGGVVSANSFIASTRDIADSDFLAGNLHFTGNSAAGVQNLGTINALGGDVYLIGKTVDNQGAINAVNGTVGLGAPDDVLLNLCGQEHVFVSPSPTATSASDADRRPITAARSSLQARELKAAKAETCSRSPSTTRGRSRATASVPREGRARFPDDRRGPDPGIPGRSPRNRARNGGQDQDYRSTFCETAKTIDASGAQERRRR